MAWQPPAWSEVRRRLRFSRIHRPYTLVFSLLLPIPGVLALVYGSLASRAFDILDIGFLSHVMGAGILVGCLLTLAGIALGKSLLEATGLTCLAAGSLVYGFGAILGLGLGGAFAGTGYVAIAIGTFLRVISLTAAANANAQAPDTSDSP